MEADGKYVWHIHDSVAISDHAHKIFVEFSKNTAKDYTLPIRTDGIPRDYTGNRFNNYAYNHQAFHYIYD